MNREEVIKAIRENVKNDLQAAMTYCEINGEFDDQI